MIDFQNHSSIDIMTFVVKDKDRVGDCQTQE